MMLSQISSAHHSVFAEYDINGSITIEGEVTEESTGGDADDDSLLPGPSFISIVAMLGILVYRRRK